MSKPTCLQCQDPTVTHHEYGACQRGHGTLDVAVIPTKYIALHKSGYQDGMSITVHCHCCPDTLRSIDLFFHHAEPTHEDFDRAVTYFNKTTPAPKADAYDGILVSYPRRFEYPVR